MPEPTPDVRLFENAGARVGIILRTKNRPWFLRRALADIAAQTYQEWSLQVVNDGGDLGAVDSAVERSAGNLRGRTAVLHHSVSRGRSAAANAGIAALRTELVVVHDDDDLWDPHFLARTVDWLDDHPTDAGVSARTEIVYEEPDSTGDGFHEVGRAVFWPEATDILYTDLLRINRLVPISFLYRRRLHDDLGGYREDVHAAEDWEFYLRVAASHRIGYLAGPPLAFWMQRESVTGDLGNSMFALEHEHEKYSRAIRDEMLRRFAVQYGPGLPLYITELLHTQIRDLVRVEVRDVVREELTRALDARPTDLQRIVDRLRRWSGRAGKVGADPLERR